jgi:hypothetical protein
MHVLHMLPTYILIQNNKGTELHPCLWFCILVDNWVVAGSVLSNTDASYFFRTMMSQTAMTEMDHMEMIWASMTCSVVCLCSFIYCVFGCWHLAAGHVLFLIWTCTCELSVGPVGCLVVSCLWLWVSRVLDLDHCLCVVALPACELRICDVRLWVCDLCAMWLLPHCLWTVMYCVWLLHSDSGLLS